MMMVRTTINRSFIALLAAAVSWWSASWAMPVGELIALQQRGERITIIDVRPTDQFTQSHIVGAINIPAPVLDDKPLPPLGRVVVYGAPNAPDEVTRAIAALNQKPGIQAEALDGGLIRWYAENGNETRSAGMAAQSFTYVTPERLSKLVEAGNVAVIDMRTDSSSGIATSRLAGARITRVDPAAVKQRLARMKRDLVRQGHYVVLIGDDQSVVHETAQALFQAGMTDFAILTGGSQALEEEAAEGSQ